MATDVQDPSRSEASMLRLCRWLLCYALRRPTGLVTVGGLLLLKSGFDVLKPWPMKILADQVLDRKEAPPALQTLINWLPGAQDQKGLLAWCVASTVIFFLAAWALSVASAMANINFGQRMIFDLAADLFAHLQRLSLRFHSRKPTGDLLRRVTGDTACVSTIVKDALLPVIGSILSLAAMFVVMWGLNPALTLFSIVVIPIMLGAFRAYARPMMDNVYAQQEAEGRLYNVIDQTLSSIAAVQVFSRESHEDRRFTEGTGATIAAAVAATSVQLRFKVWMGLATALGTAGIVWIGANQALSGKLTVGSLIVFLSYLQSLYGPLEAIFYCSSTVHGASGSARRVLEILDIEPEVRDAPNAKAIERVRGEVSIENVIVGYDPGHPVLHGISLECKPGQLIAIVGQTGAGKSTLMGLLPRVFDPWQGNVTIDGVDLRDMTLASLRKQISIVQQEPFLFPITIAQNIAYGKPEATKDQIEAAAIAANAHEFIAQLPDRYDTIIGERGATLSVGQRQRLTIARAILKDAPILIMDEPTSALDAATEASLMEAMRRLMAGRSVFVIAHRLSTVRQADQIIVLEDGRIIEMGRHEELLARGGKYAKLYELQFSREGAAS